MRNECHSCRHTWFPRGHDLSDKCPSCGSDRVHFEGSPDTPPRPFAPPYPAYAPQQWARPQSKPVSGCAIAGIIVFVVVVIGMAGCVAALFATCARSHDEPVAPVPVAVEADAPVVDASPVIDAGRYTKKPATKPSATFTASPALSAMLDERMRATAPSATTSKDADTSGAGF